jgi:threonine/homoserine/homoserine lactone efflux protein
MSGLAALAGRGGALLRSPNGQRVLNRSAGGAMVGAGAVIIAR